MRIVSLLPSATEIAFAIGAGEDVVGVTFECDEPPEARSRTILTSSALPEGLSPAEIDAAVATRMAAGEDLYRLHEGALADLDPDVVLTQDLCAVCAVNLDDTRAALDHLGCRAEVVTLDPHDIDGIFETIVRTGDVLGRSAAAATLVKGLEERLAAVSTAVAGADQPRVAVLEWVDPLFAPGHWVPEMVTRAGGIAAIGTAGAPSVRISAEDLAAADADVIVVAPCGFGLDGAAEQAAAAAAAGVLPDGVPVWAIDADGIVVRPGPRVVDGVEAMAQLLHPELMGTPDPASARRLD
ncbi:MAG: ABC transporter substrate-binding protein [Acidimicrobiia bacterium]|nr:ABC transporter substrate-binding protein [Acidimicrobiia bacterium]